MSTPSTILPTEEIDYPDSDGQPMAENTLQFRWITTIQGGLDALFRDNPDVFVAGDSAAAPIDAAHVSVMSCQHARPMGRIAGHNVVCDLIGEPMLPLDIGYYVTCLDLGAWGAVYTEGWDRRVAVTGAAAKRTKRMINCERIYPPRSRNAAEILAAAAPVTQAPPQRFSLD